MGKEGRMRELTYAEKLALKMFGGIPAGNICGMPVLIDPRMLDNRIKFVHPDGREDHFELPA